MVILKLSTVGIDKENPKIYRVLVLNEDGSIIYDRWIRDHAEMIVESEFYGAWEAFNVRTNALYGGSEEDVLIELLPILKDQEIGGLYVGYDAACVINRVKALGIKHDLKALNIKEFSNIERLTHPYDRLPMTFDAIMKRNNIDYGDKRDAGQYALASLCLYKKLKK